MVHLRTLCLDTPLDISWVGTRGTYLPHEFPNGSLHYRVRQTEFQEAVVREVTISRVVPREAEYFETPGRVGNDHQFVFKLAQHADGERVSVKSIACGAIPALGRPEVLYFEQRHFRSTVTREEEFF